MFVRPFGAGCEVQTPAKLNLFLEVLGRRPDGFHELETLMTTVSLCDSLVCQVEPDGPVRLDCAWAVGLQAASREASRADRACAWEALPPEHENLALRAVEALRRAAGEPRSARLRLIKRIPAAAGLGGASSDAAAALVAANEVWGLNWSRERLQAVAATLGSDIPFFLTAGGVWPGAAVCRGRGERIEPVPDWPTLAFVAVRPPVGLSTPAVFRECRPPAEPRSVEPLLEAARTGDLGRIGRLLHNGLQAAAGRLSPWIGRLEHEFNRLDLPGHAMSGSGSTYFGVCRHAGQARRAAGRLRNRVDGAVFWGTAGR